MKEEVLPPVGEEDGRPLTDRNGRNVDPTTTSSPTSPSSSTSSSSATNPTTMSQDPKLCGVCGDKALGNNFNAITCESCKAFFRRNALRTKEFVCPFSDSCKVDPVTRRFCQKCRLRKCFDIGMKKEWIMTDEEKKMKKEKIEQNKLKRERANSSDSPGNQHHHHHHSLKRMTIMQPTTTVAAIGTAYFGNDHYSSSASIPNSNSNDGSSSSSSASDEMLGLQCQYGGQRVAVEGTAGLISIMPQQQLAAPAAPLYDDCGNGDDNDQMPVLSALVRPGEQEGSPLTEQRHTQVIAVATTTEESRRRVDDAVTMTYSNSEQHQYNNHYFHQDTPPPQPPRLEIELHAGGGNGRDDSFCPIIISDSNEASTSRLMNEEIPPLPYNSMESILSVAISAEFNSFGLLLDPSSPPHHSAPTPSNHHHHHHSPPIDHNPKALNKAEKAKLDELFFASEALNAPVDLDAPIKMEGTDPSLINVINLTDVAIRRLIKMSKKLEAFKSMCQEDQIALLKGGCTEMMILRSVVSYDPERDSWNIPHSNGFNVKLGVLKEARGNLYEEHQRFVKSFKPEWRGDYNIMIILCAITLFTPERPNVIHKDVVKLEQDCYYYLLKRYLESTRNGCDARSTYLQLIQRIAELHILNYNHVRVFLEVNPKEVGPLLIEIFDLKQ